MIMNESHGTISERLRKARSESGMTQKEVADFIGKDSTAYGHYERGRNEMLRDTALRISEVLKIRVEWLMYGKGPMRESKEGRLYELLDSVKIEYGEQDALISSLLASLEAAVKERGKRNDL